MKGADFTDICDRVEAALKGVIPLYFGTPDFGGNAPEKYAVYTFTEKGGNYSEGVHFTEEFMVSINVYTKKPDFALYHSIKRAMYAAYFSYVGGGIVGDDKLFPYDTHYYLDFSGVMDCGQN